MLFHANTATKDLVAYYNSNIIDNSSYVERICLQLSTANLPVNTEEIIVGVKSITGNKLKIVDVADKSIWGILLALYNSKANYICVNELYNIEN